MSRETGLPRYIGKFDSREEALNAVEELSSDLENELDGSLIEMEVMHGEGKWVGIEIREEGSLLDRVASSLGGEY